ncbi:unnamed protein product, partial [Mesorhabditis spiculigera]
MAETTLEVGDRIFVNFAGEPEQRGFLRYLGPVDGQKGTWCGIEWDDVTRGKHNGTVNGRDYFRTREPKAGSFVKRELVSGGKNLFSQIEERYAVDEDNEENEFMGSRMVEKVGMQKVHQKQRDIFRLKMIVLDGMRVAKPPPLSTPLFSCCSELNLHNNLLHRWKDVFDIVNYFPNLRELILRQNAMENVDRVDAFADYPDVKAPVFHLVLNYCGVSETTITAVLSKFPAVTDLYASGNCLTSFNPGGITKKFQARRPRAQSDHQLRFDRLGKRDYWARFLELDELPRFGGCAFRTISKPENAVFEGNPLNEWSAINALSSLKSLSTLFISSANFTAENGMDVREVLIAKLPTITMLNRGDVSVVERRSAEMRFVNRYSQLAEALKAPHEADLKRLIAIHGEPIKETVKKGISVIRVKLIYEGKMVERPVPASITVAKLQEIAARVFSLDPSGVTLFVEKEGRTPDELSILARQLSFYSIEAGDTIRIDA